MARNLWKLLSVPLIRQNHPYILYDLVGHDSAGRLHIDNEMIDEVKLVKQLIKPVETLLDAMMGQDAITVARPRHLKCLV